MTQQMVATFRYQSLEYVFLQDDTMFKNVFSWHYEPEYQGTPTFDARVSVVKSINRLLRALACRRAASSQIHDSFETQCPYYVLLRTNSTAEWVLREFSLIYQQHIKKGRYQSYDVQSPIGVKDLSNRHQNRRRYPSSSSFS